MTPSRRFATIVLAAGIVVLAAAILLGEAMGDHTLGTASDRTPALPVAITPAPEQSAPAYASDWKNSHTLSAASDPAFPDPRVPPVPIPTLAPAPTRTPSPKPTRTLNPNIPIWDQTTLPNPTPETSAAAPASPSVLPSPSSSPQHRSGPGSQTKR